MSNREQVGQQPEKLKQTEGEQDFNSQLKEALVIFKQSLEKQDFAPVNKLKMDENLIEQLEALDNSVGSTIAEVIKGW